MGGPMTIPVNLLMRQVQQHPYPLLFATISGAHLYGFPSPDSDFDLRGVHVLPLKEVVGLQIGPETIEKSGVHDGLDIDLVTHDAKKFFNLLLKKNGYVLEQVFSPLIVHATPEHAELKEIAKDCITKHHAHHYLGFAETQWKLFAKESPPPVAPSPGKSSSLLATPAPKRASSIRRRDRRLGCLQDRRPPSGYVHHHVFSPRLQHGQAGRH